MGCNDPGTMPWFSGALSSYHTRRFDHLVPRHLVLAITRKVLIGLFPYLTCRVNIDERIAGKTKMGQIWLSKGACECEWRLSLSKANCRADALRAFFLVWRMGVTNLTEAFLYAHRKRRDKRPGVWTLTNGIDKIHSIKCNIDTHHIHVLPPKYSMAHTW